MLLRIIVMFRAGHVSTVQSRRRVTYHNSEYALQLRIKSLVVQVLDIDARSDLVDFFSSPFLPFGVRCEQDGRVGESVGCCFVTSKIVTEQITVDLSISQVSGTLTLLVLFLGGAHQDTHEVVLLLCTGVHSLALFLDHFGHVLAEVDHGVLHLFKLRRKHPCWEAKSGGKNSSEEVSEDQAERVTIAETVVLEFALESTSEGVASAKASSRENMQSKHHGIALGIDNAFGI